jgi:hypothetical protein
VGGDYSVVEIMVVWGGGGLCSWCFRLCGIQLSRLVFFIVGQRPSLPGSGWAYSIVFVAMHTSTFPAPCLCYPFESFLFNSSSERMTCARPLCQKSGFFASPDGRICLVLIYSTNFSRWKVVTALSRSPLSSREISIDHRGAPTDKASKMVILSSDFRCFNLNELSANARSSADWMDTAALNTTWQPFLRL